MKKNILIISYSYPPLNDAGAQRPYALAKYLDKTKFNITVLTCKNPSSPIGINKGFNPSIENVTLIKIESFIGSSINSFNISKKESKKIISVIKSSIFKIGQNLIFPDKGAFWYPNVKTYLKQNHNLIEDTDIIFSTSPEVTNHRIARYIKRKNKNIQWIADFRDFNYVENWDSKSGIKAYLHKKLERSIIKEASALTFVTKTMQNAYQKFYPQYQNKTHCIYNGFDKGDFPIVSEPLNEKLSFFYAGSFYNGLRSPFPLMQFLDKAFEENLLTKDEVQIHIAGNIDEEQKQAMKDYKSYHSIKFLGNQPRTEVLQYMCRATFLWLIVANIKSHYQTIPIKLFEYIAARRPIVNFAPILSESSQIIQEKNLGYNFNTLDFNIEESYPVFKELLLKYKKGEYTQQMSYENLDSFTWENQINKIEHLL